ncbi:hypothetical protein Hsar01_03710 [Haloferula sargassicola]|uniref:Uncharacterized protein n=2 Tax=Haloferula sargassicola TaxID=490096 RepID=A0ABP9USE1_9BACT
MSFHDLRILGKNRDGRFYHTALTYAQVLWRRGLPAQAILQIDRAFGADLAGDAAVLTPLPPPYAALRWMLEHRPDGRFLGNPVRHFQHLATRVKGVRREVRSARAWACLHLAEEILPADEFPRDLHQIQRESITIPDRDEVRRSLEFLGWPGEADLAGL